MERIPSSTSAMPFFLGGVLLQEFLDTDKKHTTSMINLFLQLFFWKVILSHQFHSLENILYFYYGELANQPVEIRGYSYLIYEKTGVHKMLQQTSQVEAQLVQRFCLPTFPLNCNLPFFQHSLKVSSFSFYVGLTPFENVPTHNKVTLQIHKFHSSV
jgi:hypothetical protein